MYVLNLPGWRWAGIKQLALVGSSSSLHSEACKALGGSDGVIHSRISDSGGRVRANTNRNVCLLYLKIHTPAWRLFFVKLQNGSSAQEKASSTLRASRAVPHPGTDRALRRLTSEFGRDPVHSTRYGRWR